MDPLQKFAELPPAKRAYSLAEQFKAFAFKGSVIDLAVGVIIGAAFTSVVNSLVKNVVMPLINLALAGDKQWEHWSLHFGAKEVPYGLFLGEILNFLLAALILFVFVAKFLGWVMRFHKQQAAATPPLTKDQELLTEIRDLLRQRPA